MIFAFAALAAMAGTAVADEFTPGRPGATESAIAVPTGRWQIETEIARVTHDDEAGDEARSWSAAATTIRYGLARHWDVEAIIAPYERATLKSGGVKTTQEGFGDVTLRARRTFAGEDGGASFGVIGFVTLPTAEDGLGADDVEGGVLLAGGFDLSERWSLSWTGGVAAVSNGDEYDAAYSGGVTLGYALSDRWGVYAEAFAERGESDDETAVNINAGVTFLANARTQFDAGLDVGASGAADDVSVFFGWARLF